MIIIIASLSYHVCIWDVRKKERENTAKCYNINDGVSSKKSRWCTEASGMGQICGMTTVCSILVRLWLGCVFVCMISFGACGVTEVSGLWLLLCEAALHPPAVPNPWCGACTYLNSECKFTALVKTSSSENARQNTKRNTTALAGVFILNNHSSRSFHGKTVSFQNKGHCKTHLLYLFLLTWGKRDNASVKKFILFFLYAESINCATCSHGSLLA